MAYIHALDPFETTGENVGERWLEYKKAFKFYAAAAKVVDVHEMRDFFLHTGGRKLQKLYETFVFEPCENGVDPNPTHGEVVTRFDAHFVP